jgi:hypothetical protein
VFGGIATKRWCLCGKKRRYHSQKTVRENKKGDGYANENPKTIYLFGVMFLIYFLAALLSRIT